MKMLKDGLSGQEIIGLVRKGHMVRRSCWVEGFLIRLTNERGFDENGNAVFDIDKDALYTHATNGYFLHLGHSSQPFNFMHHSRDAEGIGMLFANDWEDWGFVSNEDFDEITERMKENLREQVRKFIVQV